MDDSTPLLLRSKTGSEWPVLASVHRAQNSCIMRLPKLASGADSRHTS